MTSYKPFGISLIILIVILTPTCATASDWGSVVKGVFDVLQQSELQKQQDQQRREEKARQQQRDDEQRARQQQYETQYHKRQITDKRDRGSEENSGLVLRIQQMLNEMGYSLGKADGIFGTKTRNSIIAFQRDYGLKVDGKADKKLLSALDEAKRSIAGNEGISEKKSQTFTRKYPKNTTRKPDNKDVIFNKDEQFNPHLDFPTAVEPTFDDLLAYYIASVPHIEEDDQFVLAYAALHDCNKLLASMKNEFDKHRYLPEAREILSRDIKAAQQLPPPYYRVRLKRPIYGTYDFDRQEFPFTAFNSSSSSLTAVDVPESFECLQGINRFSLLSATGSTPIINGFRLYVTNGITKDGLPISSDRAEKMVAEFDILKGKNRRSAQREVVLDLIVTPGDTPSASNIMTEIVSACVIDPNNDEVMYVYDNTIFKSRENSDQKDEALSIALAPNIHFATAYAHLSGDNGELIESIIKRSWAYANANEFSRPEVLEEERDKVRDELARIEGGEPAWRGGNIEFGEYDLDTQCFAVKDVSLHGWVGDGYNNIVNIVIANSNLLSKFPMNPEVARKLIDENKGSRRQFSIVARLTPTGTGQSDKRNPVTLGSLIVSVDEAYIMKNQKVIKGEDGRYSVKISPDQMKAHINASEMIPAAD